MLHDVYKFLSRRLSWSVQLSLLLVLAAIIPLVITIICSEMLTRPALVSQVSATMQVQAQTQVNLIDEYLIEHLRDVQALSQSTLVQKFMVGDSTLQQEALSELELSQHQDTNYESWSLFDRQGNLRLSYPTAPLSHNQHSIFSNISNTLQQHITANRTYISDVFYDATKDEPSVDIYAPVITPDFQTVGFVRATFDLRHIWKMVDNVPCANSEENCYAFILDQHGVRIAYTNPDPSGFTHPVALFKAVAPLSPALLQLIRSENLYGNDQRPVGAVFDKTLAEIQHETTQTNAFQIIPTGQSETFQAAMFTSTVVPWTYFLLKPLSKITAIADQQMLNICLIATCVLILVIIIGTVLGNDISRRILRSIERERRAREQEQRAHEQERRAREQQHRLIQLKDQFILNVSHELRTPLTEIYGYLDLLSSFSDKLDTTMQATFLKHALHGCEELQLLVNNILDSMSSDAQLRPPQAQNILVAQTVKDVLELFNPQTLQDHEIHLSISESLTVKADQQYLRQVLRNLLSNAFKYSPPQTSVTISASLITESAAEAAPSSSVCISVQDSGPGISQQDIPLLFEKFVRLQRDLSGSIRGTGLGLYISKHIVEAMGGRIWVESSGIAGQGSKFCFLLPSVSETPLPQLQENVKSGS
jgi:signal transduction histidine kinase